MLPCDPKPHPHPRPLPTSVTYRYTPLNAVWRAGRCNSSGLSPKTCLTRLNPPGTRVPLTDISFQYHLCTHSSNTHHFNSISVVHFFLKLMTLAIIWCLLTEFYNIMIMGLWDYGIPSHLNNRSLDLSRWTYKKLTMIQSDYFKKFLIPTS